MQKPMLFCYLRVKTDDTCFMQRLFTGTFSSLVVFKTIEGTIANTMLTLH